MCGIAGYYHIRDDISFDLDVLKRMIQPLTHRGPDGFGFYSAQSAGLAHSRLSIVDLEGGWQPITNEDRSLWIIFNGEIFNHIELRSELIGRGHRFSTHADTEVILHLYEEKGPDCLSELNGQFAIAIFDERENSLFLARDRMGIRPLFYTQHQGTFYFASEIKSIFNGCHSIPREINPTVLGEVFTYWSHVGEDTVFTGIKQIPPGHFTMVTPTGIGSSKSYWSLPFNPDEPGVRSEDSYAEELRALLIDSVRLRLRADVAVGAYLSGGLDSSAVTSLVKNYTSNDLKTFSLSFSDKVYDETDEQQQMVRYLNTDHQQVTCSYEDIADVFPEMIYHTETPVLRTAPAPLFLLSKLVRENQFKVVLTGEGADEVLGGYDIFKEAKVRAFIQAGKNSECRPHLLRRLYPYLALSPTKSSEYARKFFNTDAELDDLFYAHRPRWKTTAGTHMFFTNRIAEQIGEVGQGVGYLNEFLLGKDILNRAQYVECKLLMANYLLASQGDRVAMANSVEGRFPYLDHRVVEFAGRIPSKYKMKALEEKNILKRAVKDILPKQVVRRKKQPYMAPDILSFFGGNREANYLEQYLSENALKEAGFFKPELVARLLGKCRRKSRQGFRENMAFVGILSTQILYDKYISNFETHSGENLANVKVIQR